MVCLENRGPWFRWGLFHLPGPSIFPKGDLCNLRFSIFSPAGAAGAQFRQQTRSDKSGLWTHFAQTAQAGAGAFARCNNNCSDQTTPGETQCPASPPPRSQQAKDQCSAAEHEETRSRSSALLPFAGEGLFTKNRLQQKTNGSLTLTSQIWRTKAAALRAEAGCFAYHTGPKTQERRRV